MKKENFTLQVTPDIKSSIADIAVRYRLTAVVLFGSQATGRSHEKSDIDIAVISCDQVNLSRLALELEALFQKRDVDIINVTTVSPTLMHVVSKDGILLYEKRLGSYLTWKVYAAKVWMETEWLRLLRDRKLIEWSENYHAKHS